MTRLPRLYASLAALSVAVVTALSLSSPAVAGAAPIRVLSPAEAGTVVVAGAAPVTAAGYAGADGSAGGSYVDVPPGHSVVRGEDGTPVALEGPPASCTNLSVCGYVNTGYRTDQGYELIPTRAGGTCVVVHYRNAWSGVYNNSGRTIRMYRDTSCGNDYKTFTNGSGRHEFWVRFGPTWDNTVDAIKFL